MLISLAIALFTRWILISSLTSELKRRGMGIAQSIAESSRGYILTKKTPELTSLIFDARLGERKFLIIYIFVLDKEDNVLSHTFTDAFPEGLHLANKIPPELSQSIKLLRIKKHSVYDVAVPVKEGIYQIATVHAGLNKKHIDQLINKLRTIFLGFLSAITIICFGIGHWLSKYITRPVSELINVSDEISRGNFDIKLDIGSEIKCWEMKNCQRKDCPAFHKTDIPCWYVDGTYCSDLGTHKFPEKLEEYCCKCSVYKRGVRDEVVQLADSFINMTSRIKISQAMLKDSEGKYRSLFHSGPNPIFVLDRESLEILDANPSAEEIYGYPKEELTGKLFTDLGPFEYEYADTEHYGGEGGESVPYWQKTRMVSPKIQHYKNGNEPFYVNIHACPARYQDRDALIVGTTDITEMIEKDAQLIQASKMTTLGEMSAGIAHELNQPLNAIKMGSEFLKMMIERENKIPDQDLYQVVDEMSEQVDRAADIINHLRDFGRKADFTKEKISINKPIKSVLEIVGKQLSLQNIEVELDMDDNIPFVSAHNNRLEQVIFNLVTNARDAINQKQETMGEDDSRVIRVRSFTEDKKVAVTVSDTGIGIPESVRERIFEAFFTTKQMGEGMGLGLSITNGIVKDYDGNLHIDSREGEGTTFKITFPQAPE
ncbi:MAG: PAS domain S-box protein [Desulfobacterales bacterium]|nr:PAS domain S-box protein [Desulfobacterales bacterium]